MHANHSTEPQGTTPRHPPLTFSRVRRSMWMTHFLRYTVMILPSRPCNVGRRLGSQGPTN